MVVRKIKTLKIKTGACLLFQRGKGRGRQISGNFRPVGATTQDLVPKLKRKKAYTNMNCLVIVTHKNTLGSWPGRMAEGGGGGWGWGTDLLFEPCDIGGWKSCLVS